jgi:hypothetical protein
MSFRRVAYRTTTYPRWTPFSHHLEQVTKVLRYGRTRTREQAEAMSEREIEDELQQVFG